jgi:hypothetical protein
VSPAGEPSRKDAAGAVPIPSLPTFSDETLRKAGALLDLALARMFPERLAPRPGELIMNLVDLLPRSWEEPLELWFDEAASLDGDVAGWLRSPWLYGSLLVSAAAGAGLYWAIHRRRGEEHRPERIDWANEPFPWVGS